MCAHDFQKFFLPCYGNNEKTKFLQDSTILYLAIIKSPSVTTSKTILTMNNNMLT
jgi:hypothetical protein